MYGGVFNGLLRGCNPASTTESAFDAGFSICVWSSGSAEACVVLAILVSVASEPSVSSLARLRFVADGSSRVFQVLGGVAAAVMPKSSGLAAEHVSSRVIVLVSLQRTSDVQPMAAVAGRRKVFGPNILLCFGSINSPILEIFCFLKSAHFVLDLPNLWWYRKLGAMQSIPQAVLRKVNI